MPELSSSSLWSGKGNAPVTAIQHENCNQTKGKPREKKAHL